MTLTKACTPRTAAADVASSVRARGAICLKRQAVTGGARASATRFVYRFGSRLATPVLCAIAFCIAAPDAARADVVGRRPADQVPAADPITSLHVATEATGPAVLLFPQRTTEIWVTFGYSSTSRVDVTMAINSPNGLQVFARDAVVDGVGAESWRVTGDHVLGRVADTLGESAEAARRNAQLAAEQQTGTLEYTATAIYAVGRMKASLEVMGRARLPAGPQRPLRQSQDATATLAVLASDANLLPPSDLAGRRLIAGRMIAPASVAMAAAEDLAEALAQESGLTWPLTVAAEGELRAYTVGAGIGGRPARSTSFWVYGRNLYLPWAASGR
jgi:hypothetical protein